ncbi:hypothetical protein HYPSUDRAFT_150103 [Hypholoma sublateritium FD-334 SS-4]|uniref:UAA transporter n=1 Tax=Hypholoma sublateritium (strain FD-334 SS-4) TaxID=945553 RepID=A0A0D2P246_HYPSF|nr:hypothetical protein HYPSUDRAFT_150103 [Hypholoma sublateritium FD-334 SS-4]
MLSQLSSWTATLSLIFGGCCSNAITLEQLTLEHPKAGSLLTLFQFLLISLHGLPKFLVWTRFGPQFRPRRVPIISYLAQVVLFYLVSLLNNAAFAYNIPMAVHIIFRSGGLIISLVLGWIVSKKRYSQTQVLSVILVTVGVILTTLSAQSSPTKSPSPAADTYKYVKGIGILTLALVLSGFLGLVQDWTFTKYGRPTLAPPSRAAGPAPWQESMFYLHLLGLPMFLPLLPDLLAQLHDLNTTSSLVQFSVPIPIPTSANFTTPFPLDIPPPFSLPHLPIHIFPQAKNTSFLTLSQESHLTNAFVPNTLFLLLSVPTVYLPLVLNTVTQLICVAGVHRLTTRVSSLTVTLILVVRKAVSLVISVIGVSQVGRAVRTAVVRFLAAIAQALGLPVLYDSGQPLGIFGMNIDGALGLVGTAFVATGPTKRPQQVDNRMMWSGAALVLLGTIGYTVGNRPKSEKTKKD